MLAARCSPRELHGASVSDRPDPDPGLDPVPVRAHAAEHLHELAASQEGRSSSGWGTHAEPGRATRSSWMSCTSTIRRGSIARAITTAKRCTSSSATPHGSDHINYEVTIEDPKVYTRAWKMSMPSLPQARSQHAAPRIRVLGLRGGIPSGTIGRQMMPFTNLRIADSFQFVDSCTRKSVNSSARI